MTTITNLTSWSLTGGGGSAASIAQFARPANTTAYAAQDVISDDAATAKAIVFPGCGKGKIIHAVLAIEESETANFALWVFETQPTNQKDNATLTLVSADMAKLAGVILFNMTAEPLVAAAAITVAQGHRAYTNSTDTYPLGTNPIPYSTADSPSASNRGSLFGLLQTSAFTPESATKVTIRLGLETR